MSESKAPRLNSLLKENGVWLTATLAFLVFAGLLVYGEFGEAVDALKDFDRILFLEILGLASIGYVIRFAKWEYYLRSLGVRASLGRSLLVFLSGLMMVVTPGKAGEVWKAWFLKDLEGVPVSRTAPVVGAERATDLLALMAMALTGIVLLDASSTLLVAVALVFLVGVASIQWRGFWERVLESLEGVPLTGEYIEELEQFYESSYVILRPKPLFVGWGLSILAWGLEGVALWLTLEGLGFSATMVTGMFVFGAGSVVGAVSMLPGGLGAAEASMVGLLVALGYTKAASVSATLIIRIGTLWYAALLGFAVFIAYKTFLTKGSIGTGR